jgi:hypothetical protein
VLVALLPLAALHHVDVDDYRWRIFSVSAAGALVVVVVFGVLLASLAISLRAWIPPKRRAVGAEPVLMSLMRSTVFGAIVGLTVGAVVLAIAPGPVSNSVDERRVIPVYPTVTPPALVAYSAFFPNGSPRLTDTQRGALTAFFEPLRGCGDMRIAARGFASSARYKTNNERKQLKLIEDRIDAVRSVAKVAGIEIPKPEPWQNLETMAAAKLVNDGNGIDREVLRERFNRRVNVEITSFGSCIVAAAESK